MLPVPPPGRVEMLADFIPATPILLGFVVAGFVLALTPGPDMTYFLSRTVAQSRRAGYAALGGVSVGCAVHSVLVAAGLSVLLAASTVAFTILKIVGAAYLAYLAYDAIRNGSALSLDPNEKPEPLGRVFVKGLLINLLNPKVIVFFVTFLPQFVSSTDPYAPGKLLFLGLFFTAVNIPVCAAMIWFADRIAGLLKRSSRVARIVDYAFATVLGAFAVKLILTQSK
jgi:threonine/homoserine/homoserine lactone efflux protein